MFVDIRPFKRGRTEDVTKLLNIAQPRLALVEIEKKTIIRTLMTINITNTNNPLLVSLLGLGFQLFYYILHSILYWRLRDQEKKYKYFNSLKAS